MLERKRISNHITYIYLFWWVQWTIAEVYIIHYFGYSWAVATVDSLVTNVLLTAVMFTITNVMKYYMPGKRIYAMMLIWNLCIAALSVYLFNIIMKQLFASDPAYLSFVDHSLVVRFCFALLMITCSTMISWILRQLIESRETESRNAEVERLARESELMSLRQQLQPHFLFNSLNSISALTGSRPEEARKMIQQLSDFLRGTLRKDDQQIISLDEELRHLQLYLDIEKVRFGHRLNISMHIDDALRNLQIPSFLLQPVVENAIKFGLYDTIGETGITISASQEGHHLLVKVSNPYDAEHSRPRRGTGYGLSSVERRLYLLFGRNDLLQTNSENHIFHTQIKIPQLK